ncbi:hypothetical protein EV126DRAFT_79849 [Verticillium dahliae]|nr:hypothetical protein EV126DRAFT_79849 [Verticillium dahliae]
MRLFADKEESFRVLARAGCLSSPTVTMTRSRGWFTPPACCAGVVSGHCGGASHVPRTMALNGITWNTPPQNITTKANGGYKGHGWDPGPVRLSIQPTLVHKSPLEYRQGYERAAVPR